MIPADRVAAHGPLTKPVTSREQRRPHDAPQVGTDPGTHDHHHDRPPPDPTVGHRHEVGGGDNPYPQGQQGEQQRRRTKRLGTPDLIEEEARRVSPQQRPHRVGASSTEQVAGHVQPEIGGQPQ